MKKIKNIVIGLLVMFAVATCLSSCSSRDEAEVEAKSTKYAGAQFVMIDYYDNYYVVYNKATKVMYVVSDGRYNRGTFTLLVNPDGTPMLYEGGK